MLNQQTLHKLYVMRLNGMADAFRQQLEQPDLGRLSFEERFGWLVDRQWSWKEDRALARRLRNSRLKSTASVEDIDYQTPRGLDRVTQPRHRIRMGQATSERFPHRCNRRRQKLAGRRAGSQSLPGRLHSLLRSHRATVSRTGAGSR
jgi:hypothetical protein